MAILKIYAIRSRLDDRIKYALSPSKTACPGFFDLYGIPDTLTSGINCLCIGAYERMVRTKEYFDKPDKVLGYHFIQSFKPGEVTPEEAHTIGQKFAERCFGENFEVVIGTHTDKNHIHNHILINSVSFVNGRKYRSTLQTFYGLRSISDEICRENGLSVIDKPSTQTGKHYAEWKAEQQKDPTIRSVIRQDIDLLIGQARTMDEFWELLRSRGYEVRLNEKRKYVAMRPPNGSRFIRLKSLGEDYTPKRIAERIAAGRGQVLQNIEAIKAQRQQLERRKKYTPLPHSRAPKRRKKLRGFRALLFRYLYLLGKVKTRKAPRRVRGVMLDELRKLDRYKQQYYFLRDNHLHTKTDVETFAAATQNEMDILTGRRALLYAAGRKPNADREQLRSEVQQLTAKLREHRQRLRLCNAIQRAAPEISLRLQKAQAEQRQIEQKNKTRGGKQYEHRERRSRPDAAHGTGDYRVRPSAGSQGFRTSGSPAGGRAAQPEADHRQDQHPEHDRGE